MNKNNKMHRKKWIKSLIKILDKINIKYSGDVIIVIEKLSVTR